MRIVERQPETVGREGTPLRDGENWSSESGIGPDERVRRETSGRSGDGAEGARDEMPVR